MGTKPSAVTCAPNPFLDSLDRLLADDTQDVEATRDTSSHLLTTAEVADRGCYPQVGNRFASTQGGRTRLMPVNTLEELESKPLSDAEWRALFEQWVRELPEMRRRTEEAMDRLRRTARGSCRH